MYFCLEIEIDTVRYNLPTLVPVKNKIKMTWRGKVLKCIPTQYCTYLKKCHDSDKLIY